MAIKRYIVQPIEGEIGIERSSDPPAGRRIYRPGEVIELDESVHNVAALLAYGKIVPAPEEPEEAAGNESFREKDEEPAPKSAQSFSGRTG